MRLSKRAAQSVSGVVARAMAGECVVRVAAPSRSVARRMFYGVTPHIENLGGRPAPKDLFWRLPNGSEIRIEVKE